MFNISQLRYFRLVAETGSFAAASERANITQPALSNAIRTLEDRIGLQLFDRSERPVRLTAVGRDLYQRTLPLLTEVRNLETQINHLATGVTGFLRIGMTSVSAASIGGAILGEWCRANPGMSSDLTVADTLNLLEQLRKEELDLIIGEARDMPEVSTELDMTLLEPERGCALCRADHPILQSDQISFPDMLPYRFAGSHFPIAILDATVKQFSLGSRADIEFALESDNIAVLQEAVRHSDLILLTTPSCVRDAVDAGFLCELPIELGTGALWKVATLKNTVPHPAIPSLQQLIIEIAAQNLG